MKTEKWFMNHQMAEMLSMNIDTFINWRKCGYITPDIKSKGQGTRSFYSERNLQDIKLFKALVEAGASRSFAKRLVQAQGTELARLFFKEGKIEI